MSEWPDYPYQAARTNPYSLMSRERNRLFFVTCDETLEKISETAKWLLGFEGGTSLSIYRDGKVMQVIR